MGLSFILDKVRVASRPAECARDGSVGRDAIKPRESRIVPWGVRSQDLV